MSLKTCQSQTRKYKVRAFPFTAIPLMPECFLSRPTTSPCTDVLFLIHICPVCGQNKFDWLIVQKPMTICSIYLWKFLVFTYLGCHYIGCLFSLICKSLDLNEEASLIFHYIRIYIRSRNLEIRTKRKKYNSNIQSVPHMLKRNLKINEWSKGRLQLHFMRISYNVNWINTWYSYSPDISIQEILIKDTQI